MGFIKIPHSTDRSAYGFVPVPIAVVGGSEGPSLLLLAGVYGDEIAAQIAVSRIVRSLDPGAMRGRVVAMSMANFPAALAGTRISPVDGRNLNKSFPGDVLGTPTSIIADYIERHLMPDSDIVIDVHSEGRSMRYLPVATFGDHIDPDVQMRRLALAEAFGLRNVLRFRSYEDRSTSGAARRAGATRIGAEISGTAAIGTIADGVARVLAWAGMIERVVQASEARLLLTQRDEDFVYALSDGVFEPVAQLGDLVAAGDLAGHMHDLTRPLADPTPVHFAADGIVVCTRGASQAARGDCLMHLAAESDREASGQLDEARALRWLATQKTDGSKRRRAKNKAGP